MPTLIATPSPTAAGRRWVLPVAIATAAVGLGLLGAATRSAEQPGLWWPSLALVGAAILEFAAGGSLTRRGGAGMSHTFAGALAFGLAAFLAGVLAVYRGALEAQPVAMVLAVYCLANGLFRLFDVLIDRPAAGLAEAFDGAFTLVLGAVVLETWHVATPAFVAVVAGLELLVGGLTMAASAISLRRNPRQPPYRDLQERLSHGG
jgi:uncharacterized membrane protein HdeD (DUF308 family)